MYISLYNMIYCYGTCTGTGTGTNTYTITASTVLYGTATSEAQDALMRQLLYK
jgi:hypothetical protein